MPLMSPCNSDETRWMRVGPMRRDKNRRNVQPAVGLKLSTAMKRRLIRDEIAGLTRSNSRAQASRLKRTRINFRKCLGAWLKDATRMPLGKLSLHVKHGTSDASFVGGLLTQD